MSNTIRWVMIVLIVSMFIAMTWDSITTFKTTAHAVLDPTAGSLLDWNLNFGMLLIVLIISFVLSAIQKATVDPELLREIKEKQKKQREEFKKHRNDPKKLAEIQKKQMESMGEDFKKNFEVAGKSMIYTAIPIILFFRWFNDYFGMLGNPKFFGFLSWFWYYLILILIFSTVFKKIFKM